MFFSPFFSLPSKKKDPPPPFTSPVFVLWSSPGILQKIPHSSCSWPQGVLLLAVPCCPVLSLRLPVTYLREPEMGNCGSHFRRHLSPSSPSWLAERLQEVRGGGWRSAVSPPWGSSLQLRHSAHMALSSSPSRHHHQSALLVSQRHPSPPASSHPHCLHHHAHRHPCPHRHHMTAPVSLAPRLTSPHPPLQHLPVTPRAPAGLQGLGENHPALTPPLACVCWGRPLRIRSQFRKKRRGARVCPAEFRFQFGKTVLEVAFEHFPTPLHCKVAVFARSETV